MKIFIDMSNNIFRERLKNNIDYMIKETENTTEISHPGLVGRFRELVTSKLIEPMLPAGFEIGTGKIVDSIGNQSAETDLIIYNRAILPPIMYSNRDGIFPIESSYYAIEVKSCITAKEIQDTLKKGLTITSLSHPWKQLEKLKHRTPIVHVLFALSSDLAESSSEIKRYAQYDKDWQKDPIIKALCVVNRGYWYHESETNSWVCCKSSPDHDEIIDFISGIINTIIMIPPFTRTSPLGHYLIKERPCEHTPP